MKKAKKKKPEEKMCLTRGQLKTVIDEEREGGICDSARSLISSIDEEFDTVEEKKVKGRRVKREKSYLEKIWDDWF